ncbi:MAG: Si-specific NAD(P)(+) transhydrogenase [Deltaproteobacteria bacterium]|nr:MAG: Si-specific NAD(P)(+) transhydrogenase [Deltaproteobacteria bacterium]
MTQFDLVVIGSGPAGEKGAAQAAYFGKRVALVERAPEPGGAAVHTGTLPSKTLREASVYLSGHRQRELYGISLSLDPAQATPRLLSRKDAVRTLEVSRIRANLDRHRVTQITAHARFLDASTVEVIATGRTERLTAERFLIATGSRPYQPNTMDFTDPGIHDSDSILRFEHMPRSLAILGGGVIGCEYATMFAALGVPVQLVEPRDTLLPFLDAEISEQLRLAMLGLGIELHLGDGYRAVRRVPGVGIVTGLAGGAEIASDQVLFAAGRSGNTGDLGLEEAGVAVGQRGYILVDDDYRTSVPHIYAAGDCVGFPALASTSMEQARVAVCHAFGFAYKRQVSELLPYGVYTIPEVSSVGLTERQAGERTIPVVVGRAFYRDNARGKIVGDRDGLVKLLFARDTRQLIGCHCIGEHATELVHVGQGMILLGGTVETLIEMVFNYPTLAELYKYAAYDALDRWE